MSTVHITPLELVGFSTAMAAAHHAGLTRALLEAPGSVDELASRTGLAVRPTQLVLEVLAAFGVVEQQGARFHPAAALLTVEEGMPGGIAQDATVWSHAPRWLADGKSLAGLDSGRAGREEVYSRVTADLGALWSHAARALAQKLGPLGPRVLDVGCGSGVWGLAAAEREKDTIVTGVDFPAVLEVFKARAKQGGVEARAVALPGDAHLIDVPRGQFDTVLVANVLRLEAPVRARALLKRWAGALTQGGRLIVVDAFATGGRTADRARTLYALHLALRTDNGRVHPSRSVSEWMVEAGLDAPESVEVSGANAIGALGALVARKR